MPPDAPSCSPENSVSSATRRIVTIYASFAGLWILLSDQAVAVLFSDPQQILTAQTVKGWLFVVVTSLLLMLLVRHYLNQLGVGRQALTVSEERWKFALEGSGDGVWDVDPDSGAAVYSRRWKEMLGYAEHEISNQRSEWEQRVHPEDMPGVLARMVDYQEGRSNHFRAEYRMRCKDGSWKWIQSRGMVVSRKTDGRPLRITGTHTDITSVRQADDLLRESEQLFRLITENIHDLVALIDRDGRRIYNSPSYLAYFDAEELRPGTPSMDMIHPDDRPWVERIFHQTVATGIGQRAEFRFVLKDGRIQDIESQGSAILGPDGEVEKVLIVSRDVTERKLIERTLRESEERFRNLADSAPVLIWVAGTDKLCFWFNKTWLDFTGRSINEEWGNGWAEGVHPDDLQQCFDHYNRHFDARLPFDMEYRLRNRDGEYRWMIDSGRPRIGPDGNFAGYIGTMVDITERRQIEQELQRQARIDYLTGIANRRYFIDQSELELSRTLRYDKQLSVLMLDIDHFKQVNDTHGHRTGDIVLQKLSLICKDALRDVDVLGRLGGEEFAVLLPETPLERAVEVAERLRDTVARSPIAVESGLPLNITVSIGVATLKGKETNIDMLLNLADGALYRAKEGGRNRVVIA